MSAMSQLRRAQPGDVVGEIQRRPTAADVFRFSAVTWNAHRIHYDPDYARSEGLDGAVVQAHLHGAYFSQVAQQGLGPSGRLRTLSWRNLRAVTTGQLLTIRSTLEELNLKGTCYTARCIVEEFNEADELCAVGKATIEWQDEETGP